MGVWIDLAGDDGTGHEALWSEYRGDSTFLIMVRDRDGQAPEEGERGTFRGYFVQGYSLLERDVVSASAAKIVFSLDIEDVDAEGLFGRSAFSEETVHLQADDENEETPAMQFLDDLKDCVDGYSYDERLDEELCAGLEHTEQVGAFGGPMGYAAVGRDAIADYAISLIAEGLSAPHALENLPTWLVMLRKMKSVQGKRLVLLFYEASGFSGASVSSNRFPADTSFMSMPIFGPDGELLEEAPDVAAE